MLSRDVVIKASLQLGQEVGEDGSVVPQEQVVPLAIGGNFAWVQSWPGDPPGDVLEGGEHFNEPGRGGGQVAQRVLALPA